MTTLAQNKRARFDYEILDTLEAGLVLTGAETKSVKKGQLSLKGSFVTFQGNNAYLTNTHISPYPQAGPVPDYDPTRSRRLLLHKKEIAHLRLKTQEQGLTIVPLEVYTNHRLIKVAVAVARGKHTYDKREVLKKRDLERELKKER